MTDSLHSISIGDVLRSHRRTYPHDTATVYQHRRFTYLELDNRINQLVNALKARGLAQGSRLLWLGQNGDRVLELFLAAAKLGAVFIPVNWRLSDTELAWVIDDSDADMIFWQLEETGELVNQARSKAKTTSPWVQCDLLEEADEYESLLSEGNASDDEEFIDPSTSLLQIYTAAFDGHPQGALVSHQSIMSQSITWAMLQDIDSNFVFLNSGPMFHIGVWMATWPTLLMGGTNVFVRRVDAQEICELVDREKCTGAYLVGSTQQEMVDVNKEHQYDLKSLRSYHGSDEWNSMTTPGDARWFRYFQGWGQTEVNGLVTHNGFNGNSIGSHGRTMPLSLVRIFDDEGNEVPDGEVGEIVVRGASVMNGYHRAGAEPETRTVNGWHRSNDLGKREKDGSVSFIGPKQRMLKSGVENIYPAEVEACLSLYEGVTEVAIIGIPSERWIQTVKAIIVSGEDANMTLESIQAHCKEKMASYKKPTSIELVAELPKKGHSIDYDALDEMFGGGNYPGQGTASR